MTSKVLGDEGVPEVSPSRGLANARPDALYSGEHVDEEAAGVLL
jgi:hypothetical protein